MTEGPHGTQFGRYDAYKPLGNPPLERRYYWDVAKPMWHFKLGDVGIFALNHPHREGATLPSGEPRFVTSILAS